MRDSFQNIQEKQKQIRNKRLQKRPNLQITIKVKNLQQNHFISSNLSKSPQKKVRKSSNNLNSFDYFSFKKELSRKESFDDHFELLNKIGQGGQSIVYLCKKISNQQIYAVKCMRKNDEQPLVRLKQQYKILKSLNHESIIEGYHLYLNEKQMTCFMICEFCDYPDLRFFIRKQKTKMIQEDIVAEIVQRILVAVQYLHEKGVCHRDLKPDNILFDELTGKIKIIDFELGKMVKYKNQKLQMWSRVGTLHYRAPQSFKGCYTELVDSWSIGIIAYQLLTKKLPFNSPYESDLINSICNKQPNIDSLNISDHAKSFLQKMLDKNQKSRYTPKQALSHPFILIHITGAISSPNIKLNKSFDQEDERKQYNFQNSADKFYCEEQDLVFSESIVKDIGIRFHEESQI